MVEATWSRCRVAAPLQVGPLDGVVGEPQRPVVYCDCLDPAPLPGEQVSDPALPLVDEHVVPQATVLLAQRDELTGRPGACRSARLEQEQEREQAEHLSFVGHELGEYPS